MAFTLSGLGRSVVDTCGGDLVTVYGSFTQGASYTVEATSEGQNSPPLSNAVRRARAAGTQQATLAYSGTAQSGVCCVSRDGQSIQFAAPASPPGPVNLTVTEVATGYQLPWDGALQALPAFISSFTFTLRSSLPLNYATGPRSIDAVPVPSSTQAVAI